MSLFGIPNAWLLQDAIAIFVSIIVFRYAVKKEKNPGEFLLEAFTFCFLYASVFENGAAFADRYHYGRSIFMIGITPFTVPLIEYLAYYAPFLMLEKMDVPVWCKPIIAGFCAMLQDFTTDPVAVRQVYDSDGRQVGRWSWISLKETDANIVKVPVYNFPGWLLIVGFWTTAVLIGRWWYEKSSHNKWVGILYPFIAANVSLFVLASPSSTFFLWLAPFFGIGSKGEWIMLAVWFVLPISILAFIWRGRMKSGITFSEDWPIIVIPAIFHISDNIFAIVGHFYETLWIEFLFTIFHCGIVAIVWARGKKTAITTKTD